MSKKPILFYSPSCKHSVQLWKYLKEKKILDQLIKINVNKQHYPKQIKSVPSLIVHDRNQPITGHGIMMYFTTFQPSTAGMSSSQSSGNSVGSTGNNNSTAKTNNRNSGNNGVIQDYNPCEMGSGWSDEYMCLDGNDHENHSYWSLEGSGSSNLSTIVPSSSSSGGRGSGSKKNSDFDNKLEELTKLRNNETSSMRQRGPGPGIMPPPAGGR